MAIPESFIDELVDRTDITDLVGEYVRYVKQSGGNRFALCPFHSEKTPSFSVNSDKQMCYCFACHKGGGAINFIREIENLSYVDAVAFLARRAGMAVPESDTDAEFAGRRRRILDLNRDAARHFHENLSSQLAAPAREYLARRGVSKAMATRFGIGAAPEAWSLLLDAMIKKGYSKQELIDAGLARSGRKEGGGGGYDFFRNRLMFPVIDVRGEVIGFSGRRLDNIDEQKYINSPDTIVFNKRRNLFALNLAKKSKSGMLILVEGNIDVVSLHQAGFDSAVAALGTAFTAEQARLMKHYTDKAVIAYDADEPGRKATLRAIPLLEKAGIGVKVLDLGTSKDPDDYLREHSADAFKLLLERSENHIEYRLMIIEDSCDMKSAEGRLAYLSEATKLLSELESKPEREIYGERAARKAGVSVESVESEVTKKFNARKARQRKDFERAVTRPAASAQPEDRALRYDNEYSAIAEEGVIRCLFRDAALMRVAAEMGFTKEEFTSPFLSGVFETLTGRIADGREVKEALVVASLESGEASQLSVILQKPEALPYGDVTMREYIEKIRAEKMKTDAPDERLLLEIKKYKENKDVGG